MAELVAPKVILKKKQIPVIIDFCLDESIEFSVKQQAFPETDWEVELKFKDFKTALLTGMFLRENKFEIEGIDAQRYKKSAAPAKKTEEKVEAPKAETPKAEKSKPETDEFQAPSFL